MTDLPTPQISMQIRTFAEGHVDIAAMLEVARDLDAAGVDRLVVSDHIAFGPSPDEAYADPKVGGTVGGRQPTSPDGTWLEPLTVLTAIAATTDRIRLGTAILLAALRRPAVLAKTAATLDVISGGRLDLGVGVGWQKDEYDVVGLDFSDRGRILDETLAVCRTLWTEQSASYRSDTLAFDDIHQMPKPLQADGVPIWVSGTANRAVARRLVRFGTGWIPWGPAAADPASGIQQMRHLIVDEGGDPSALQVQGNARASVDDAWNLDGEATSAAIRPLVEAGVTDVRVATALPEGTIPRRAYLDQLVETFRSATGS